MGVCADSTDIDVAGTGAGAAANAIPLDDVSRVGILLK